MNKKRKRWTLTACGCIAAGLLLFAGAFAAQGFDIKKLSTVKYETNVYEVYEDFDCISLDLSTTEVTFVASEADYCRIECIEAENETYSVDVQNKTLNIRTNDTRKWYEHIGISFGKTKITVYLPKEEYIALSIETSTGDIRLADLNCKRLSMETDTGTINLENVTVGETIKLESDTGEIELNNCNAENIVIKTDTGDIDLNNCDAEDIMIKSDTGEVTGILLSGKVFITKTSTGDIDVPEGTTGGKCEITTSTGDIKIRIQQ